MAKKSTRKTGKATVTHKAAAKKALPKAGRRSKPPRRRRPGRSARRCTADRQAVDREPRSRRRSAASRRPIRSRKGELQHINPFTLLVAVVLSAQATDAGVNKATPALFAAADTPEKMVGARRGARARADQDHRPVPHQGEERRRAVAQADRRAWRQGAALARGAGGAARRRPQDRQRRAQHRLRPADHRGRHAYLPRRQPHRARARQDAVRGRD